MRDDVDAIIEQWRAVRPELDSSPIGIVGRVSRLARELEARLEPVYKRARAGARAGTTCWPRCAARAGQLRVTDLTAAMMIGSSGTTKRLDRLEKAGLVARSPDPNDRRGTLIELTAKGRELIDERHAGAPGERAQPDRVAERRRAGDADRAAAQAQARAVALKNV